MQPRKSTNQSAAKMLKQTTLLGGKTRPASPSTSKPRPMCMEVVICRPAWTLRVPQSKPDDVLPQPAKKPPPPSAKRADKEKGAPACRKRKSRSVADSDPAPPTRKRKTLKKAASRVLSDNSGDEVDSEHILSSRLRTRNKLSQRDKLLLKLKRKRQGLSSPPSTDSESDDESESESERDSLFDGDSSTESNNSADFIVEDDGSAPAALPKEFSMDSHEDLSFQFKKIFQFMVHIAVRPPLERKEFMKGQLQTEEYFSIPLTVTRRKIAGLRDLLVASSRWHPHFVSVLQKYPDLQVADLTFTQPKCDACRISARRSKHIGRLSGLPYEHLGFQEILDFSSDEGSDDDEEDRPYKKDGSTVSFHLGRFCAERVKVFHQLTHWEYNLFKCVAQEVDELHEAAQGDGVVIKGDRFVRVKYAGGKQPPEDLQDADGINDWLAERNIVEIEWAKLEALVERSQNLETAAKRGQTD